MSAPEPDRKPHDKRSLVTINPSPCVVALGLTRTREVYHVGKNTEELARVVP
jgi:hypothetical protein